jgi:aminopeptidase N
MRFAAAIAALILQAAATFAEEPFAFDKTPGQLPKDVVPKHYAIRIVPDIAKAAFTGSETIEIEARKPMREIVLNSLGLEITNARLNGAPVTPKLDEKKQTLTFPLATELPAGAHKLELDFAGKLNEQPFGLFITRYQDGTTQKRALATQMEATDARRMFPCWDEPVFRATFELTAVVPTELTAISNMPATGEKPLDGALKEVRFARTPSMASYLVAFFAGELESIEDEADGVKLRIFTTAGKREQARYAMAATKQILPYFNEYFGTKYPLPKLDQVAFPSTGASGMENWGAILYTDTALLYDPATSSQGTKEGVFGVVAHEIAHQWFGDLVTMAWWDNLWLNEGFASWMGTKAMDHFNPEWQVWLRAADDRERAMQLDARATTHPIQQPVATEAQANDAFDQITYQKGQSFIRMLENWLGESGFCGGIREYMKRHAYSSTTTADLWQALEDVSGKPVRKLAAGWTEQPGFPVVIARDVEAQAVELKQEHFTLNQTNSAPLQWSIPIALGPAAAPLQARTILLKNAEPVRVPIDRNEALKLNIGDVGYFRATYDDTLFARLRAAAPLMAAADRLSLLNDTWAMAQAGRAPVSRYLDLVSELGENPPFVLLDQALGAVGFIDYLERGQPGHAAFREWALALFQPELARLGWDAKPGEKALDGLLRAGLIGTLGSLGDAAVKAEARKRFDAFLKKPASLTGDLRGTVLHIVGRDADAATWEKLHELGKAEVSTEQKRALYGALASARSPELARKTLAISLTDELVPRQATRLVHAVGSSGEQPELALEFAQANLDALLAKVGSLDANSYVPGLFRPFADAARADELEAFASAKLPPEAQPQVARAADEIRFKAALKARLVPEIDAWCRARTTPPAGN